MKTYTVYNLKFANILARKGFQMLGTGVNTKNPKYFVYFFEDTEEFRTELAKLIQQAN